jgi:tRNA threonylcarbamoyladenosine biosynthesis protein TsaB
MIVLGIDTSGYSNAIGVVDIEETLANRSFDARTDSLEQIVDNIDSTLKIAGLTLDNIQGIGVGLGPGSWTGIRVGVTVGKMLAFSLDLPVCGVSTLASLAYRARHETSRICAVVPAGTGDNVYAALYVTSNEGVAIIGDYFYGDIKELLAMINEPAVLVGKGAKSYLRLYEDVLTVPIMGVEAVPDGAVIARLANQRLARGESDDTLALTPLYLKESTAKAFVNKYKGIATD